jgi:hypothetical protein
MIIIKQTSNPNVHRTLNTETGEECLIYPKEMEINPNSIVSVEGNLSLYVSRSYYGMREKIKERLITK